MTEIPSQAAEPPIITVAELKVELARWPTTRPSLSDVLFSIKSSDSIASKALRTRSYS